VRHQQRAEERDWDAIAERQAVGGETREPGDSDGCPGGPVVKPLAADPQAL